MRWVGTAQLVRSICVADERDIIVLMSKNVADCTQKIIAGSRVHSQFMGPGDSVVDDGEFSNSSSRIRQVRRVALQLLLGKDEHLCPVVYLLLRQLRDKLGLHDGLLLFRAFGGKAPGRHVAGGGRLLVAHALGERALVFNRNLQHVGALCRVLIIKSIAVNHGQRAVGCQVEQLGSVPKSEYRNLGRLIWIRRGQRRMHRISVLDCLGYDAADGSLWACGAARLDVGF